MNKINQTILSSFYLMNSAVIWKLNKLFLKMKLNKKLLSNLNVLSVVLQFLILSSVKSVIHHIVIFVLKKQILKVEFVLKDVKGQKKLFKLDKFIEF